MSANPHDAAFWTDYSEIQRRAHDFTSPYARRAWELAAVPPGGTVLDIAAGTGALALVAARAGARVLATDFSPGMVESVRSHNLPNIEARVMDGQALDLPDAAFDAAFSLFGVILFPDWRRGVAEMARVVRPGGVGCLGTWRRPEGAAANLLLADLVGAMFPRVEASPPLAGMAELSDPDRLRAAMRAAGFAQVSITDTSNDFLVDAATLDHPGRLFQFSPLWPLLDERQRAAVLASIRASLEAAGGVLAVASPALIATARRA